MNRSLLFPPFRAFARAAFLAAVMLPLACSVAAEKGEALEDPIPEKIQDGDVRVELEMIAEDGLSSPVFLTHAGDGSGRLFVVDQAGRIYILKDGELMDEPFLDLSDRLVDLRESFDERGLLGLAFHPGFADENSPGHRKLYTYSCQPVKEGEADFSTPMPKGVPHNNQVVVAEWRVPSVDANSVDKSSRREILRINEPQFNHDGGMLAFAPESYAPGLYIAVGDGGAANDMGPGHVEGGNGQNPSNPLGAILRIDPLGRAGEKSENGQYSIPSDNPFVGDDKALDEVWAYGLRNAWRFSFDKETGRLIAADVGQGRVEEVDVIEGGGNYGWHIKEGTFYFKPKGGDVSETPWESTPSEHGELIDPVVQYDHGEGLSTTGGYVYRGSAVPALEGRYVFGDWKAPSGDEGRLFHADLSSGEIHEMVIGKKGRSLGTHLSGFGEGPDGELYLLTNQESGPLSGKGQIWKIVPVE